MKLTHRRRIAGSFATLATVGAGLATASPALAASTNPIGATVAVSTARTAVPKPPIVYDPIPYGAKRKAQMAAYAQRHYGTYTYDFVDPKVVLLHFTVTRNYRSTWDWMAANSAAGGNAGTKKEKPGACTHFVIGKTGKIYQLAPLDLMCRHVVGINDRAIGIEFIEMTSAKNILRRAKQRQAGVALVRWLQSEYDISKTNVVGHAGANESPFFRDRLGWFNDHSDWSRKQVKAFSREILD